MVTSALVAALVYFIIYMLDVNLLSWQCLTRPIVVAPIMGLALGDFTTGILMGAALESIFMGISAIGGSVPADATVASIIAVNFTVLTGSNIETGLAIALPIGTLIASFNGLLMPIYSSVAPYWERLAVKGTPKQFFFQVMCGTCVMSLVSATVIFVSVAFGVNGLNSFLASLPTWVMGGLGAATGMMIAIGFAILTSMIWSANVGIFFFLGYVLVKFANLGTVPIAIIGATVAITVFVVEKHAIDTTNKLALSGGLKGNSKSNDKEDFF